MFTELDKDFDGKLSWKEFIGEETSIEIAFKLFDENKDGTISKGVCYVPVNQFHQSFIINKCS